jgi:hypothetical protein
LGSSEKMSAAAAASMATKATPMQTIPEVELSRDTSTPSLNSFKLKRNNNTAKTKDASVTKK